MAACYTIATCIKTDLHVPQVLDFQNALVHDAVCSSRLFCVHGCCTRFHFIPFWTKNDEQDGKP
jgi:hypothetical protein